jgi:hypothetical protein
VLDNEFRDPLHGDIRVSSDEIRIIDQPIFQRLRRCSQLPFVKLVFPGATHTRFEHSIGVMHLSNMIFNELDNTNEDDKEKLRVAALLHDIAEPPYYPIFKESDTFAIDSQMREFASDSVKQMLEAVDSRLDPTEIISIIYGDEEFKLLHQIIDSEVGANRIDYLLRDSYFCGVTYGKIDPRILFQFSNEHGELVLRKEAIPLVDTIFNALFQMKVNVYDHKIARAAFCLTQRALERQLESKSLSVRQLMRYDDNEFLSKLQHYAPNEVESLRTRNLPRLAYYLYSYALRELNGRKFGLAEELEGLRGRKHELENEIRKLCGGEDVTLDFVQIRPTKSAPIRVRINGDVVRVDEVPLLTKWYHDEPFEQWRLHIFSSQSKRNDVAQICDGIFGFLELGREQMPKIRIQPLLTIYEKITNQTQTAEMSEKIRAQIFSLPDNTFETLEALVFLGRATAQQVGERTNRSRATESALLNTLYLKRLVERRKMGRRIEFTPTSSVSPIIRSIFENLPQTKAIELSVRASK